MFCPNCGTNNADGSQVCANCGTPLGAPQGAAQPNYGAPQGGYGQPQMGYGQPQMGYGAPQPGFGGPQTNNGLSYFDGEGGEYLVMYLVNLLVTMVTCGIALPWVMVRNLKWRKSHTVINGRRLCFTGTTGELFKNFIIWWLLSVVTCGIYSIFVHIKLKEWEITHTGYADMNPVDGQTFMNSFYDGTAGEYFGVCLVARLAIGFSCGIATPWMVTKLMKFDFEHTVVCGDRLGFDGTGSQYWGENAVVGLLTSITCGIYGAWGVVKINKWTYRHSFIASQGNTYNPYT